MTDQTIQNKQAFVVVDSNTMERISKFYSKRGLAEKFIKDRVARYDWKRHELAVAVYEYKEHYEMEENV